MTVAEEPDLWNRRKLQLVVSSQGVNLSLITVSISKPLKPDKFFGCWSFFSLSLSLFTPSSSSSSQTITVTNFLPRSLVPTLTTLRSNAWNFFTSHSLHSLYIHLYLYHTKAYALINLYALLSATLSSLSLSLSLLRVSLAQNQSSSTSFFSFTLSLSRHGESKDTGTTFVFVCVVPKAST